MGMEFMKFSERLAQRDEGFLLPNRPPINSLAGSFPNGPLS
jgi:hypothetical protein